MTARDHRRAAFLIEAGWGAAEAVTLPSDASSRRYYRLSAPGGRRALLMDAPPPLENVPGYLQIGEILRGLGYSVPRVLTGDAAAGFLIIEDLGDATYTRVIAAGGNEAALYALATDLLIDLHDRFDPLTARDIPPYGMEKLLSEAALLLEWFLPAASGRELDPALLAEYRALWQAILPLAHLVPQTLALRDYHIDNLMLLPDRAGLKACGLLDFQDAMIGPIGYDLVSLIEDARRDVSADVATAMRARYLAARPGIDPVALDTAMAVLGAQRHAKCIGLFCRLARRDGKPVYLKHLPRLWRRIEASLLHPTLAPLRDFLARHIPQDLRGIPASLAP